MHPYESEQLAIADCTQSPRPVSPRRGFRGVTHQDLKGAEARADVNMRKIAIELKRRAVAADHAKAIDVCDRFLNGDDSAGDDIQQGMRDWGL